MRARRLAVIATWINENRPELMAKIERGYCNTDRKPAGCRYITHKGKGREGNRLKVFRREDLQGENGWRAHPLLDHNSAETYRCNQEVENWLEEYLTKAKKVRRRAQKEA